MKLKEIWNNYFESFTAQDGGFMRRKLMAFAGVWTAAAISWRTIIDRPESGITIIGMWLIFALLCAGLITFEQVMKLKNPQNDNSSPTP